MKRICFVFLVVLSNSKIQQTGVVGLKFVEELRLEGRPRMMHRREDFVAVEQEQD